jgi:hypothetical protein
MLKEVKHDFTLQATSELIKGSVIPRVLISEMNSFKELYASCVLTLRFNVFAAEPVSPRAFNALAC